MDYTELDKLEANIKRIIETVQNLQGENHRLKQENQNLLRRIRENEEIIQELKIAAQYDGDAAEQLLNFKEKEGKLKQKIQKILEKLETVQQLSSNDKMI